MDFTSSGISFEKHKALKLQETWLPVTPAKPIPTRPGESQGGNHNWFDTAAGIKLPSEFAQGPPSTCLFLNSNSANHPTQFHNWEPSQPINNANGNRLWNSLPFTDLLALANNAPTPHTDSTDNVLAEHIYSNSSQHPHYGFPALYTSPAATAMYDLNSSPGTLAFADAVSTGNTSPDMGTGVRDNPLLLEAMPNRNASSQFAPLTPQKQHQQYELVNNLGGEGLNRQENRLQVNTNSSSQESCLELPSMEKSSQLGSSGIELCTPSKENRESDELPTPLKENHQLQTEEENGIDLNKTPRQKHRRKKHRPRVVTDKKPRAPKSAAKTKDMNEPQRVKRKYVRRGTNTSSTPPADVVGETKEADRSIPPRSCKRSLNFDQESQTHESHSKTPIQQEKEMLQNNLNNASSCFSFNDILGVAFQLNCTATQMLGDYISLPESTTQPTRRELLRKNLKVLGRNGDEFSAAGDCQNSGWKYRKEIHQADMINGDVPRNHEGSVPLRLQTSIRLVSKSKNKLNGNEQPTCIETQQETISKRAHSQIVDGRLRSFNQLNATFNPKKVYEDMLQASQDLKNGGMLFPEIFKKRRTMTTASKSHAAMVENSQREAMGHCKKNPTTTSQGNSQYCDIGTQLGNGSAALTNEYCSLALTGGNIHHMQPIPVQPVLRNEAPCRATSDKMMSSELLMTIRQTEMKTRKRTKGHTRVRDLASLTSVAQCNSMQSPLRRKAPTSYDRRVTEMVQGTQYNMPTPSRNNHVSVTKVMYSRKESNGNMVSFSSTNNTRVQELVIRGRRGRPRGSLKVVQQFNSPIEDLIQRLNRLSISGVSSMSSSNEQTALVPFKGDDRIVPYRSKLDKKRRPRAKVDLDSETDRVWKLLMGKEASEGAEGTEADKEKWWEEERRVFRGRADSFIARMHLIQGDRRFSKWNGSVLDSVIGVFLTQNVSDHLSSSAFMSLAAQFPLKRTSNEKMCHEEETRMYVEEPEIEVLESDNANWHENMTSEPVRSQDSQGSVTLHEAERIEDKETGNSVWSSESNTGARCSSGIAEKEFSMYQNAPNTITNIFRAKLGCTSFEEAEDRRIIEVESSGVSPQNSVKSSFFHVMDGNMTPSKESSTLLEADRRALEDVVSSKSPANSSINKKEEIVRSCSDSNSEEEDPSTRCKPNDPSNCTSFMELLRTTVFQECYNSANECLSIDLNSKSCCIQSEPESDKRSNLDTINAESSILPSIPEILHTGSSTILKSDGCLQSTPNTGFLEVQCPEIVSSQGAREITEQSTPLNAQAAGVDLPCSSLNKQSVLSNVSLEQEFCLEKQLNSWGNNLSEIDQTCRHEGNQSTEPEIRNALFQRSDIKRQQVGSISSNFSGETVEVVESSILFNKKYSTKNGDAESVTKGHVYSSNLSNEKTVNASKPNGKPPKEKQKATEWDYLRKEAYQKCGRRERNSDTVDSLDWEAVRCADVNVIAECIKARGMNNMLARRIKDFLNRLVREHESIDLEWLRDVPPDKTKEYLLSVRGLGLKSVECIRLLTLHHLAFPVDTNVGRIAVRLGWVPLQPLPESLQLHLLEMYPIQESIQKYLWPRLCTLDQRTLYELHYQLITFGKVFCTKNKPNCNACPMRAECKHFASAFASARLALPGPEEKGIVSSTVPPIPHQNQSVSINPTFALPPQEICSVNSAMPNQSTAVGINTMPLPLEANMHSETGTIFTNSEPIIEVPASPEPECNETPGSDIEDAFWEDPDEIPTIKLNIKNFALNLQNYMQENNIELQDGDMSKCLVALNPEAASIPTPKLKNVGRLRTEHQVYELPDSHPLLEGVEKRVPGEVCSYLLAIWTPGETPESTQLPERCCDSQMSGNNLCTEKTCFSCNSIREANSQTVRGTLLIPCKTAMRGSFPLNGTYFQVNEVFADHDSSLNPIDVPRTWLWNLPRRTVYFGSSVPTIFRGQSTEQIQSCFWRGYVCVRGFDQKTRAPRPLMARLHFPASKMAAMEKSKR